MSGTIGSRLKKSRKEAALTQTEAAKRLGVSFGAISKWENDENSLRGENLLAVARLYRVSPDWITTGSEPTRPQDSQSVSLIGGFSPWDSSTPLADGEIEVPLFREVEMSAGSGLFSVEENRGESLRFSKITLARSGVDASAAACAYVSGDSMEPVLPDGACVGIDTSKTAIKDGDMYCIDHGGLLRVKILYRLPGGGIAIHSINPGYPREELDNQQAREDMRVIGRVFWYSAIR